jgi:hypothetical protein
MAGVVIEFKLFWELPAGFSRASFSLFPCPHKTEKVPTSDSYEVYYKDGKVEVHQDSCASALIERLGKNLIARIKPAISMRSSFLKASSIADEVATDKPPSDA